MTAGANCTMVVRAAPAGFFSNFNRVVDHLANSLGRDGVEAVEVDWTVDKDHAGFRYGTPEDGNLWDCFFEPLPFLSIPARRRESTGFADRMLTQLYAMEHTGSGWRQRYHRAFSRYVRVRPDIIDEVNAVLGPAATPLLGIHYRHPAHDVELIHPMPSPSIFIDMARHWLTAHGAGRIVLATDFEPAAAEFRAVFNGRVILQPNVNRAPSIGSPEVHDHDEPSIALGRQVLIDALLLARCGAVVHVASNMAAAVGYMNPWLRLIYCETPLERLHGLTWGVGRRLKEWRRRILAGSGRLA